LRRPPAAYSRLPRCLPPSPGLRTDSHRRSAGRSTCHRPAGSPPPLICAWVGARISGVDSPAYREPNRPPSSDQMVAASHRLADAPGPSAARSSGAKAVRTHLPPRPSPPERDRCKLGHKSWTPSLARFRPAAAPPLSMSVSSRYASNTASYCSMTRASSAGCGARLTHARVRRPRRAISQASQRRQCRPRPTPTGPSVRVDNKPRISRVSVRRECAVWDRGPYHWTRECIEGRALVELDVAEVETMPTLRPCKLCMSRDRRSRLVRETAG
jgi:hypothetical protein